MTHDEGNRFFHLRGDGLALYPFGEREALSDEYLGWLNDPQVTRTIGRFDYLLPVSRDKAVQYYRGLDPASTLFLAVYAAEGQGERFVGTIKAYDIDLLGRTAFIGVMIGDPACWGRGLATRAIGLLCDHLFGEMGLRKLCAGYIATNPAMGRAFEKNGFRHEATFERQVYFQGEYVDHVFVRRFREEE